MQNPNWQPVFDYLEHESRFQAAAAAVTGAAAAWLLKGILVPSRDAQPLAHPAAAGLAAGLLALASFLFLVEQGRVAKMYGELARLIATGAHPTQEWQQILVREFWDLSTIVAWFPYYGARSLLLVVVAVVAWMLFAPSR